jgi:hypothetical protein
MTKRITLTLLLALLLAACTPATEPPPPTPDANAISTAAAQTVMANIAATLAAASPTLEPTAIPSATLGLPTETPTPTVGVVFTLGPGTSAPSCDVYRFIEDVNYPDNTEVTAGQDFIKTWKLQNASPCTWAGYSVVYGGYVDKMGGIPQAIPSIVAPGEIFEVSVQFKAPAKPGAYVSAWTLANALGVNFFDINNKPFYVKIVVR